jgi:hypothetical protein
MPFGATTTVPWQRGYIIVESTGAGAAAQKGDLPDKEAIGARVERAREQLRILQAQLAQDARQPEPEIEPAGNPSTGAGYRIAARGAILTDLRRMLDEVLDIVELTSHPSESDPADTYSW